MESKTNHLSFYCHYFHLLSLFFHVATYKTSDECYSLLKNGMENGAKWVLWEAICDWVYCLVEHLRYAFIHSNTFPQSYSSQLTLCCICLLFLDVIQDMFSNYLPTSCYFTHFHFHLLIVMANSALCPFTFTSTFYIPFLSHSHQPLLVQAITFLLSIVTCLTCHIYFFKEHYMFLIVTVNSMMYFDKLLLSGRIPITIQMWWPRMFDVL